MPLAEIGECTKQVIAGENRNPHSIYKNPTNKKLVKANHCQHKTDNFYFTSYSPELYFQKSKEVITYKGV